MRLDAIPDTELRCRDDFWRASVDYLAAKGVNQIVVDVGEGLVYPLRPELAIRGSWSAEKLAGEIGRLQGLGVEVIPKLNFSTTHNGWLKQCRRKVGSPEYDRLYGFLMVPWAMCDTQENVDFIKRGADLLIEAVG